MKYIQLELDTSSATVHYIGNGTFHASFPNAPVFENNKKIKIGVLPSIILPKIKKKISFRVLLARKTEKLDVENNFKQFEATYESFDELAYIIEAAAKSTVTFDAYSDLNFNTKKSSFGYDVEVYNTLFMLTYKHNRFKMELHKDFQLLLNCEVSYELGFVNKITEGPVTYDKLIYLSDQPVTFDGAKCLGLRFLLHDIIDNFHYTGDGGRLPILFDYYFDDKYKNAFFETTLLGNELRTVTFSTLNISDNKPFLSDFIDLKANPLKLTFVLYLC